MEKLLKMILKTIEYSTIVPVHKPMFLSIRIDNVRYEYIGICRVIDILEKTNLLLADEATALREVINKHKPKGAKFDMYWFNEEDIFVGRTERVAFLKKIIKLETSKNSDDERAIRSKASTSSS